MSVLDQNIEKKVDLRMQGIDTSSVTTLRDLVERLLAHVEANRGDLEGEKWAARQTTSLAIPLRVAITQIASRGGSEDLVTSTQKLTESLVGDITLIGFSQEDEVEGRLRKLLTIQEETETLNPSEIREPELVE